MSAALLAPILAALLAPIVSVQDAGDGATLVARIDALAAEELAAPGAVGLSVGVARRGEVLLAKGYGLADVEHGVPARADTLFRIGSVTKQFTSALIMRYVEDEALALDDELEDLVPEFPLHGRRVTVEHLLAHTSGIKSYTSLGQAWRVKWPLELTHEELLALVADEPFGFEPGTGYAYNNTGYYLLGMIVERLSGKSYEEALEEEFLAPLGLAHTRRDSNRDVVPNRAQGYDFADGELVNDPLLGTNQPGAAGFLLSTGRDLVVWQMALTSGKVVSKESFARMTTPTILPDGKQTDYGFGLSMRELAGRKVVQHGGGIFGFNSMLSWVSDDDLHVAVISNGETSAAELAEAIALLVLGVEPTAVRDEPIPAERVATLVGNYRLAAIGLDAQVFEREGKLFLQATGQSDFRLLWQGGGEFRADFDTDVRLVFAGDATSFELHQGGRVAHAERL